METISTQFIFTFFFRLIVYREIKVIFFSTWLNVSSVFYYWISLTLQWLEDFEQGEECKLSSCVSRELDLQYREHNDLS